MSKPIEALEKRMRIHKLAYAVYLNVNKMCETDNINELEDMFSYARTNIVKLRMLLAERIAYNNALLEVEDRNEI